jgi:RNA polymerase sigma-54 factor
MAIELRQQLKLSQQLVMTPQLQMAIKLLQLNRLELMETIRQELIENPTLEEIQETGGDDRSVQEDPMEPAAPEREVAKEVTIEEKLTPDIDWSSYIDEYNSTGRSHFEIEGRDAPKYETFIASKPSLADHLLWQLLMALPNPDEKRIGAVIIGNLNRDGFLDIAFDELIKACEAPADVVETVLKRLQEFDPIGVCARDLKECLLIQATYLGLENTHVTEIIAHYLHHLENRNIKAICKALKASQEEVIAAINIIRSLEPRPGMQFSEEEPQYITPDIYVYKFDDDFVIMLNDDGMPKLKVNAFYKNAINHNKDVPDQAKDYIQEKLRSAAWLIRSIHQRQKTIYRVMESILKFQRDFFEKGIAYLKPMVLRDVATDIGMHESTISRVTTNKYALTPQGIFELKYFFNSSINRFYGEAIASASVQDKIRQLIDSEDPQNPYSDNKLAELLEAANINIARRTVAKYREMLRVLPSNKRKQI